MGMTLTAVLVAGGLSRRMGVDKATLRAGDTTLWARQLGELRALEPEALCISARASPSWRPAGVGVVLDEPPSRGPLSGLAAALSRARTSHILALAVDLPRITTAHLLQILEMAAPGLGVIPLHEGWFEPLCAVYPVEAAEHCRRALDGQDFSLQTLARSLAGQNLIRPHLTPPEARLFYFNANTPADL